MIHYDDSEDASWTAYALLIGKALSCARDSEKAGDLAEAGARLCMNAASHIKTPGWPVLTVVLFKSYTKAGGDGDFAVFPEPGGKPN